MEVIHINLNTSTAELETSTKFSSQSECPICFSSSEDMKRLGECQHSFCENCLQEYLKTEINSLNVLKIKCPEQTCSCILSTSTLEELLDSSDFERYQKLLVQKMAKRTQDIFCPQPGCSKIIIPAKDSAATQCGCGAVICNFCASLEHQGKTCIAALDPDFEAYAAENNLKMCLMCKTMVARVEGCTHITCSICDYEWCWTCGREYNQLHETKCPKTWSPLPPSIIMRENQTLTAGGKVIKFLADFVKFIFFIILEELFWPCIVFNLSVELRLPARTLEHKVGLLLFTLLIQFLYLSGFGVFAWLAFSFPKSAQDFIICMLCIGATPWVIKLVVFVGDYKKNQKRWKTRNAQAFHYTSAHRPTENPASPTGQNTPSEAGEVSESNDQDVIIELPESSTNKMALVGRQGGTGESP